jgi:transcriptional regulator with XRE-family HTH domain
MTEAPKGLGERIRELRERAGLSQSELARRVRLSGGQSYVSKIEAGAKVPGPRTRQLIAQAFGLPADALDSLDAWDPEALQDSRGFKVLEEVARLAREHGWSERRQLAEAYRIALRRGLREVEFHPIDNRRRTVLNNDRPTRGTDG